MEELKGTLQGETALTGFDEVGMRTYEFNKNKSWRIRSEILIITRV